MTQSSSHRAYGGENGGRRAALPQDGESVQGQSVSRLPVMSQPGPELWATGGARGSDYPPGVKVGNTAKNIQLRPFIALPSALDLH